MYICVFHYNGIFIFLLTPVLITGHPHFFNQLSCGLDLVSMAGEWLTATANTNMFTYEIAPVFILMESVVLAKMREIIGWKGGDSILAPGTDGLTIWLKRYIGTNLICQLDLSCMSLFRRFDIQPVRLSGGPPPHVPAVQGEGPVFTGRPAGYVHFQPGNFLLIKSIQLFCPGS